VSIDVCVQVASSAPHRRERIPFAPVFFISFQIAGPPQAENRLRFFDAGGGRCAGAEKIVQSRWLGKKD
jgi:hypothetical protein